MIKDVSGINKTLPAGKNLPAESPFSWQQQLSRAIRDPAELLERLQLPADLLPAARSASDDFPLLVPESFLNRMQPGEPDDPLLRQILPVEQELQPKQGFTTDAVGDDAARIAPGLLQKYHGRALMITLGTCAVHCRYCFRRHYPYHDEPRSREQWQETLNVIAERPDLEEILLSGGDPLVLNDRRLGELIDDLANIPHLQRLRIHTRLPIVLPDRVTEQFLSLLQSTRLQPVVVVHANHPAEVVADCETSLKRLSRAGFPVLNQAVLLRGVNDTVDTQAELCRRLINCGVLPYYLHQLDRIQGAAHFETDAALGKAIVQALKERLPGYAVPRFVREIAGEPSKTEM
ncbi:EF-P beta-lysylation protein EpmB [Rubinisphaera sp. JC750]|uniref:EF-P beta-lysylation protein EpmB n=1 Tax=Rubinisphaera sp. JC750 TaxID=2898658 RepID=UPI001F008F7B|nr:EF-P beta-lysylation protein EpmB [Rubinisphaera sp. JC750]